MNEHNVRRIGEDSAELGFRSHLLKPVMEGATFSEEDAAEFLAVRLSPLDDARPEKLPPWQLS